MKKEILFVGAVLGVLIGLVCGVFKAVPVLSELIWVLFTTYAIVNALGAEAKHLFYYVTVFALGWAYAFAYYYGAGALMLLGLSLPVALGIAVAVVTTVIVAIHGILLGKTPMSFGMIALAFAPVINFFGIPEGTGLPWVVVAGLSGILLAVVAEAIIGFFSRMGEEKA